ncbi:MAG: methyltransferase domain-containing protein [Caldisericia bacterium]|nr:methyltransferase domain-containing protein [Caldisericia bacterium]
MSSKMHTMIWGSAPSTTCLKLWEFISEVENQKFLIYGIGDGRNAKFLAGQGFEVVAIDPDNDSVETLKKWAKDEGRKITALAGDLDSIDIGGPYDVILSVGMMNRIPDTQRDEVFGKLLERTKPFGFIAVSVFVDKHFIGSNPTPEASHFFKSGELMGYYHTCDICWTTQELYKGSGDDLFCVDRIMARKMPEGHRVDPNNIGQSVSLV